MTQSERAAIVTVLLLVGASLAVRPTASAQLPPLVTPTPRPAGTPRPTWAPMPPPRPTVQIPTATPAVTPPPPTPQPAPPSPTPPPQTPTAAPSQPPQPTATGAPSYPQTFFYRASPNFTKRLTKLADGTLMFDQQMVVSEICYPTGVTEVYRWVKVGSR